MSMIPLLDAYRLWRRRPAEAVLGVIGVMAGVAGAVAVVAIGAGARIQIMNAVGDLGATTLIVRSLDQNGIGQERRAAVERLLAPALEQSVPIATTSMAVTAEGSLVEGVTIFATSPAYQRLHRMRIDRGRFIAWQDTAHDDRVCVLSYGLAQTLFPRRDAVGSKVRVGNEWLTVVGVLSPQRESDGAPAFGDVSTALIRPVGSDATVDELVVRFHDDVELGSAGAALRRILEFRGEGDFEYVLPIQVMRSKYRLQLTIGYLLSGISALLLIVGGIGIANVMLLNVVRRTPEIGLRRAVGAARASILGQFLIEAAMISLLGGMVGIGAGVVVTTLVARTASWPIAMLGPACVLGALLSLIVGIASGMVPAWRAARLDPTTCLSRG